jgi:hypothetical protein
LAQKERWKFNLDEFDALDAKLDDSDDDGGGTHRADDAKCDI